MSLRSPASASSPSSHRRHFFPDHASTSSGSPHVCLSPLPADDDEEFEYPYPFNRVHLHSRTSSLKQRNRILRARSRASSVSSIASIESVCSDQSDEENDANSIFSDVECTSTHTSCSSARDEVDEGKRRALNAVVKSSALPSSSAPRLRPRGPRPLPQIPTRAAPTSASRPHTATAVAAAPTNATAPAKPRIFITLDTNFCVPYVEREEDDPYSATNSPSNALIALAFKAADLKEPSSLPSSPLTPSSTTTSDSDSLSPVSLTRSPTKHPRIRFADTLMRDEDAEVSPLDALFDGVAEDDVIDWDRIEEFMHTWDGGFRLGNGCGGHAHVQAFTGGREVRCHR